MGFVVILDANVLYPAQLRDLLMRLSTKGIYQARWSLQILDEAFGAIQRDRPEIPPERLQRTRHLMMRAVPDGIVTGYEGLIPSFELPDPGDRHVVAAAVRAGAQVIVTQNLKDFPPDVLQPYGVEAKHPDVFLTEAMDIHERRFFAAISQMAASLRRPPKTESEIADDLERIGLVRVAGRIRDAFD